MKKCFLSTLFLLAGFLLTAQPLHLRITGAKPGKGPYQLILLYGDGHYQEPQIALMPNAAGDFSKTLSLPYPVFAILEYGESEQRLLLSPGRNLQVDFHSEDSLQPVRFKGTAAAENKLLLRLGLDKIPFYLKGEYKQNPYVLMSADSIEQYLLPQINALITTTDRQIAGEQIPEPIRKLLKSEQRYVQQAYLCDLTENYMRWVNNPAGELLVHKMFHWQALPDSAMLVSGFFANMMIHRYTRYAMNRLAKQAGKDKALLEKLVFESTKMPFDSIMARVNKYGERYVIDWLYARTQLNASLRDKLLFNKILDARSNAGFEAVDYLYDTLKTNFPHSPYLALATEQVVAVRERLKSNTGNPLVKIYPDIKPGSLKAIAARYPVKLIYIDIWGTWCGACKVEMRYMPRLKEQFKSKDIVFVHLDMDPDDKEETWISYLRYFNVEGEHFRLTSKELEPIWAEIKAAGGKFNLYPSYVLLGKDGRIIHADAERPSNQEKLYQQLAEVL